MAVDVRYRNKRKFDIEAAREKDGTYQALKLFAKNTKVLAIMANATWILRNDSTNRNRWCRV